MMMQKLLSECEVTVIGPKCRQVGRLKWQDGGTWAYRVTRQASGSGNVIDRDRLRNRNVMSLTYCTVCVKILVYIQWKHAGQWHAVLFFFFYSSSTFHLVLPERETFNMLSFAKPEWATISMGCDQCRHSMEHLKANRSSVTRLSWWIKVRLNCPICLLFLVMFISLVVVQIIQKE